ncbi:Transposon Ty3-I Gag-Pol polyprotein [Dictyocoela muelleri]|nr:Transposon Ty3-I Gag-Pol polyprotein [Dictyocoela muelleri]
MTRILGDLTFVKIFLDDIFIFRKTELEHHDHLEIIFKRLKINNSSVNFKNSSFCKTNVKFFSHKIDKNDIHSDNLTIEKLKTKIFSKTIPQLLSLFLFFSMV